ncbi:MAG TPA: hypothetical protein VFV27_00875, partial [Nevskiaceae bacterium]|nr:hypothetical protein [Nevskiaceae bacterium]
MSPLSLVGFRQDGAAALGVSLALMVVSAIIAVGAGLVAAQEQRSVGNEVRALEARSLAEAGLNRAMIYVRQNFQNVRATATGGWMDPTARRWTNCGTSVTPPCGDGTVNVFNNRWTAYSSVPNLGVSGETLQGSYTGHLVARASAAGAHDPGQGLIQVVGQGVSADGQGRALVRQGVVFQPFLASRPDAPLIAAGTIGLSGTISVVANPNGGGSGVPLSA